MYVKSCRSGHILYIVSTFSDYTLETSCVLNLFSLMNFEEKGVNKCSRPDRLLKDLQQADQSSIRSGRHVYMKPALGMCKPMQKNILVIWNGAQKFSDWADRRDKFGFFSLNVHPDAHYIKIKSNRMNMTVFLI